MTLYRSHINCQGESCLVAFKATRAHKGTKCQKPARNWNKKFGELAVLSYSCNNLTNLEYEVDPFTETEMLKAAFKNP